MGCSGRGLRATVRKGTNQRQNQSAELKVRHFFVLTHPGTCRHTMPSLPLQIRQESQNQTEERHPGRYVGAHLRRSQAEEQEYGKNERHNRR